ncbi:hypothetical protein [Ohtaekwangia koreensis]|uniref:Uncharacterized protein n=1 Tax=Ohtaekwangia koreensis TaxID=688867 RepID=A0A1T5M093_9BACT|nr:hypothetical protein [Ohtaekwangia koreensis]SKC81543.1 hypothetical protein SAMN05660236_3971 [Ohtaekwangia koreensis]
MHTIINGIIVLGSIALCACASSKKVGQSEWAGKPITIDGKLEEWQQPMQYYHAGTKLSYSIRNDGDRLYMCIVAADQNTQTKIALAGFQVALDTAGGKKRHVTLLYPFVGADRSLPPTRESGGRDTVTMEKTIISQSNTIRVKGFNFAKQEEDIPLQNSRGINVVIGWTAEGSLVYELALPFKTFMHTVKGKSLGIQLTVKGLPPVGGISPSSGGMNSGMPPGGPPMGGGPGSGMPSGNTMSEMSADKSLRVAIALANE